MTRIEVLRRQLDAVPTLNWQACVWDPMDVPHVHFGELHGENRACGPKNTVSVPSRHHAELVAHAPEYLLDLLQAYEALKWVLTYGTFDVAVDNPLHGRALDHAQRTLQWLETAVEAKV